METGIKGRCAKTRLWWAPEDLARRQEVLEIRGRTFRAIRDFFARRNYVEVETPALQVSPGMEPHLGTFSTDLEDPFLGRRRMGLHTSPEFAMKKLVAGGMERIFQLARVFRNGERGAHHHPEFTMLEWYRTGVDYRSLMDETEALVKACAAAAGVDSLRQGTRQCDPYAGWRRLSVCEAFEMYAGVAASDLLPDPADRTPDPGPLKAAAGAAGVRVAATDSFDDVFFRIMFEKVEPAIGNDVPCILYDYPVSMAALSRPKESDPRLAERFEVYAAGMEVSNAFSELTGGDDQRARFEHDRALRMKLYGEAAPLDEDFLAAVAALPPCSGNALGVDRLVMLLTGVPQVEDVLWAPVSPGYANPSP